MQVGYYPLFSWYIMAKTIIAMKLPTIVRYYGYLIPLLPLLLPAMVAALR